MDDRSLFKFPEEAQSVFGFLEQHGFSCVFASLSEVRYESKKVFVEISHGKWDCEVLISFGRILANEKFSFTLFLRLFNPGLEKSMGERLAFRPDQVRDCLTKLADALRQEGGSIIDGEDAMFERMKSVRWWDFQPESLKGPPKKN